MYKSRCSVSVVRRFLSELYENWWATHGTSVTCSMQNFNNRSGTHLNTQGECELENLGKRAWVNQAYCSTPPPVQRSISTVYNPQPLFHSSLDSMGKLSAPNPYPSEDSVMNQYSEKKSSGCCSSLLRAVKSKCVSWNCSKFSFLNQLSMPFIYLETFLSKGQLLNFQFINVHKVEERIFYYGLNLMQFVCSRVPQ